jgi:hypothetical protein
MTEFLAENPEEVSREVDKFASDAGQARRFRSVLSSTRGGD